jgi:uncharacterized protein
MKLSSPPPLLITSSDVDDEHSTAPRSFECDCACPDNGFSFSVPIEYQGSPLQCAKVYTDQLPANHVLMFNPLRNGGVTILNRAAVEVWKLFKTPRKLDQLSFDSDFDYKSVIARMMATGLLEPPGSTVSVLQGTPRTLSVWLHVTNQCNLRCDYCYIQKNSDRMDERIGFASIDATIRSAVKGKFGAIKLKFAGGEATLNLDLVFKLDNYAREQAREAGLAIESVVLSNGVAIGEHAISEFLVRGIRVMISLDGIGEAHDAQRKFANGRGSFAQVNRTISRLIEKNLIPFISITVTDRNTEELPETVRLALERGLPFNINFIRDNECVIQYDELRLRDDRIIAAMRQAFSVIESMLPRFSLLGMLVDRSHFNHPNDKTCGVGESYLVIDHNGRIAKCHMEIEKPVTNIYAEDPLAIIRKDGIGIQNVSVDEKEGCRECEWRYWCTGGCPLLTFKATGRYDVKSPYCRIYKAIYPEVLRLEGLRLLRYAKFPSAPK